MRRRRDGLELTDDELVWLRQIDPARVPTHIAIIMDGNGRWARGRHMPRTFGHMRGAENVERIVLACRTLPDKLRVVGVLRDGEPLNRVRFMTLYSFSSENWGRPREEVDVIMGLIEQKLREKLDELMRQGVRLKLLGRETELPASLMTEFRRDMALTAANEDLTCYLAVNYGGRQELADAVRRLAQEVKDGQLDPDEIGPEHIASRLYAPQVPDPELLIRTGGEMRVSNFLLWQIAYSELWVTPTFWPGLTNAEVYRAIVEYQSRERRFGGINVSAS
jgi:undecaprenyl diphosphate synthase